MIRLGKPKSDTVTIAFADIGVTITARAPTTALLGAVEFDARQAIARLREDLAARQELGVAAGDLPDLDDSGVVAGLARAIQAKSAGRRAIISWTGVLGADGEPAPVTPDTVAELMEIAAVGSRFLDAFYARIDAEAAEGNASRPAPNGTSETGRNTAAAAGSSEAPAPTESAA